MPAVAVEKFTFESKILLQVVIEELDREVRGYHFQIRETRLIRGSSHLGATWNLFRIRRLDRYVRI
jgi:hypothetical protein